MLDWGFRLMPFELFFSFSNSKTRRPNFVFNRTFVMRRSREAVFIEPIPPKRSLKVVVSSYVCFSVINLRYEMRNIDHHHACLNKLFRMV